jgi:hypothetical protein
MVNKTISRYFPFKLNILLSFEFDCIHPKLRQKPVLKMSKTMYIFKVICKLHSFNAAKGKNVTLCYCTVHINIHKNNS